MLAEGGRVMRRNEEVITSPLELGNSCQEWAETSAGMRQLQALSVYKYQSGPHAQTSDRGRKGSLTDLKKPTLLPSIIEPEEQTADTVVLYGGGLTPMRKKTYQL